MTATYTPVAGAPIQSMGSLRIAFYDIALDTSYPAAGYPFYARDLGFSALIGGHVISSNLPSAGLYSGIYVSDPLRLSYLLVNSGIVGIRSYNVSNVRGGPVELAAAENADQATAPTNSTLIATAANFTTMAGTVTIAVQPDVPRNIQITLFNDTGGNLNLYEGVTTFTVTGKFRGGTQTEAITFTSTSGNKAVAHTPNYRWKAGVKPFDSITSITYDNAAAATMKCSVGPGLRLGIPVALATPAYTDVLKIWFGLPSTTADADVAVAAARIVTTAGAQTFNIGDPTSVALAEYMSAGIIFNAYSGVQTGTNLSAYTVRVMLFGY